MIYLFSFFKSFGFISTVLKKNIWLNTIIVYEKAEDISKQHLNLTPDIDSKLKESMKMHDSM